MHASTVAVHRYVLRRADEKPSSQVERAGSIPSQRWHDEIAAAIGMTVIGKDGLILGIGMRRDACSEQSACKHNED